MKRVSVKLPRADNLSRYTVKSDEVWKEVDFVVDNYPVTVVDFNYSVREEWKGNTCSGIIEQYVDIILELEK